MRVRPLILLSLAFVIVLASGIAVGRMQKAQTVPGAHTDMKQETITLKNTPITVDVAVTQADQERGLGGRDGLAENQGMLFVFTKDDHYPFWMKDMKFAIDIIWISSAGKVVHIVPNLAPSTYPNAFQSPTPARSVLELPAGWAAAHHVALGDTVTF